MEIPELKKQSQIEELKMNDFKMQEVEDFLNTENGDEEPINNVDDSILMRP
jgi:hypothetical protein